MRLLDKKTITSEQVLERKIQIDEGVKLAKKVDLLRQTASEEEQKLSKFRTASLAQLHKEVGDLQLKKKDLEDIVVSLEKRKERALDKLDVEKEALKEARKLLGQQGDVLITREHIVSEKESAVLEEEVSLRRERVQVEEDRIRVNKAFDSNSRKLAGIEDSLKKRRETIISEEERLKEIQRLLVKKETTLLIRERELSNKQKMVDNREKSFIDRERAIKDRYQTLLRTEKRLNK